jgi:hypothetical protein
MRRTLRAGQRKGFVLVAARGLFLLLSPTAPVTPSVSQGRYLRNADANAAKRLKQSAKRCVK